MTTISITLASPAVAALVEEALRAQSLARPIYTDADADYYRALKDAADAIKAARARVSPRPACARCGSDQHPVCF